MSCRGAIPHAIIVVVISLLVAGCGGERSAQDSTDATDATDAKAETRDEAYESMVRDIHGEMNSAMSAAFASRQLDARLVRAARMTATDAMRQMKAANPPATYRAAHVEYTAGLTTFAAILADVEAQVDEPDVARRHLGDERFSAGVGNLEKATTLYDEAGLDLSETASSG